MREEKTGDHVTKFNVKKGKLFHENVHAMGRRSPAPLGNGRVHSDAADTSTRAEKSWTPKSDLTATVEPQGKSKRSPLGGDSTSKRTHAHVTRQPVTIVNNFMEPAEETPRIRNYQIKSVKKGVPVITPVDTTVQKIIVEKKDLRITPYWICQKQKAKTKRTATAWIFSAFVTFVSVVCPLTSFASDVAFYVTCSDHYNHTAELLTEVRGLNANEVALEQGNNPLLQDSGGENGKTFPRLSEYAQGVKNSNEDSFDIRPAPLQSRQRRTIQNNLSQPPERSIARFVDRHPAKRTRKTMARISNSKYDISFENLRDVQQDAMKSDGANGFEDDFTIGRRYTTRESEGEANARSHRRVPMFVPEDSRQTNFEAETREMNESACDSPDVILAYMLTDKAAAELEAHRHVTIDIFEPVFILGSFPSLILCILTRLVVLITAHKNFLSAYVINMACMPLQLVTGALSVHSASYHLGKKGFECWHCAHEGDCSDMDPLWWLEDGVTKSLIVSVATKVLDGIAGGVVLFIVIIRLLWSRGGHATFWWNLLRWLVIVAAFVFCVTVSPILVITPALGVMRLEFMELATPFPGLEGLSFALMALMGFGLAAWCLSFAVLLVYLCYSMYMYCRERTIDR